MIKINFDEPSQAISNSDRLWQEVLWQEVQCSKNFYCRFDKINDNSLSCYLYDGELRIVETECLYSGPQLLRFSTVKFFDPILSNSTSYNARISFANSLIEEFKKNKKIIENIDNDWQERNER